MPAATLIPMHVINQNLVLCSPSLQPRVHRLLVRRGSRALRRRQNPLAESLLRAFQKHQAPSRPLRLQPRVHSRKEVRQYRHLVPVQFLCVCSGLFLLEVCPPLVVERQPSLVNDTRGDAVAIVVDRVISLDLTKKQNRNGNQQSNGEESGRAASILQSAAASAASAATLPVLRLFFSQRLPAFLQVR
jgi:hypothetical protein